MSDTQSMDAPSDFGAEAPINVDEGMEDAAEQLEGLGESSEDEFEPSDDAESVEDAEEGEPGEMIALKVNGKTIEKSLDEIKALAQQQIAGEAKLEVAKKQIEEAKQAKAQADNQVSAIRQMLTVLQRGDFDTIAEFAHEKLNAGRAFDEGVIKYALKLYEMAQMTPEQREAVENRKLVEKYKRDAEERQRLDRQRAMEYQVNQWTQHIAVEVPKAIKAVGLPDTDLVREHIVSTWRTALENGQNPTPMAVANFVKQRFEAAKLTHAPKAPAPTRPKATARSVGMTKPKASDYIEISELRRGRM